MISIQQISRTRSESHITGALKNILVWISNPEVIVNETHIYTGYPLYGRMLIDYLYNNGYILIDLYGQLSITTYGKNFIQDM